jgi:hypothetical protein
MIPYITDYVEHNFYMFLDKFRAKCKVKTDFVYIQTDEGFKKIKTRHSSGTHINQNVNVILHTFVLLRTL